MLSQARIKWIKSLAIKKYRQKENLFIAEGDKIVSEVLESKLDVVQVYGLQSWIDKRRTIDGNTEFIAVSQGELARISTLTTPNNAIAVCKIPALEFKISRLESNYSLYLDNIQDPGNMGTILRTADWFGIDTIICSPDCVDCFNPKVVQAAMGSFARVSIHYLQIDNFIHQLPSNFPVIGASLDGSNIFSSKFTNQGLIVIGNESKGISKNVDAHLTKKVFIPRGPGRYDLPESLNASVATGIILSVAITGS